VVVLAVTRLLFAFMAGVAGSAALRKTQTQQSHTSQDFLGARDPPAGSFANMVRTDDTIFRLPRAVAELTRFRTGGVSLFAMWDRALSMRAIVGDYWCHVGSTVYY